MPLQQGVSLDVMPRIRGQEMNQEVEETSEVLIVPLKDNFFIPQMHSPPP